MQAITFKRRLRRGGPILAAVLSMAYGLTACTPITPIPSPTRTPALAPLPTATASPIGATTLTPLPPPTSSPVPTTPGSKWLAYTHPTLGFSLSHPPELQAPTPDDKEEFGFIGEKIFFQVTQANPLECIGDCPVVEMTSTVQIAGLSAIKISGYIGAVGGNVPQQYLTYLFQKDIRYYTLTLYALAPSASNGDGGIVPLKPEDIQLFEQIVGAFKFTA
jgi:hypothetical protein